MTVITSGSVSYERSVKVADFENKKLRVELSFGVEEDAGDPMTAINAVADQAMALVHDKLGIRTTTVAPRTVSVTPAVATDKAPAGKDGYVQRQAEKAAPKTTVKPPSKKAAEKAVDEPVVDMGETGAAISTGGERVEGDDLSFLDEADAPTEITDKDLLDVIGKVNGKTKNPIAIKAEISKFAGSPPKTYKDVPQEKRAAFLAALNAL